ncbi:MAG: VWA domain-containing protein [Dehalococcoidia bacterium]|nr:VWA domain-containing protein [Dehalococcoidia bacterium]
MSFAHAWVLAFLPAVPAGLAVWWLGARRGRRQAASLTRFRPRAPRYLAAGSFAVAAALTIVAAAQPRWGTHESFIPRRGAELVVVLDVSRSMAATDVQPNRLEAAKNAITASLRRLGGDRAGLVVFAGNARVRFPLTTDLEAAMRVVRALDTGPVIVEKGTNAATGLDVALNAFDATTDAGRLMVFISDGDDLEGDAAAEAEHVRASGIGLIVAGAGTPGGGTVPVYDASSGRLVDKKDANGQPIVTRLNEPFLRALAASEGGRYVGSDLGSLPGTVEARVRALKAAQFERESARLPVERYQWFAAGALALLLLGVVAERVTLPARRRLLGLSGAALAGVLLAGCASRAYELNDEARAALRAGQTDRAIALFTQAQAEAPDNPHVSLNLAAALSAAGRYDEAALAARRALASPSAATRAQAFASIGHQRFAQNDLPAALDAFRSALIENPRSDASRHDFEVVLRLLQPRDQQASDQQQAGATPTPAPDGGGDQSQTGGQTPEAGSTPPPGTTPQSGGGGAQANSTPGPQSPAEVERQLARVDARIAAAIQQAGEKPTAAEATEILKLLAERARLAAMRDAFAGGGDPRDY